jgi:hypothetical protein
MMARFSGLRLQPDDDLVVAVDIPGACAVMELGTGDIEDALRSSTNSFFSVFQMCSVCAVAGFRNDASPSYGS